MADAQDTSRTGNDGPAGFDRERFGGTERRRPPEPADRRAPITSSELSKAPAELAEDRGPRVNYRVLAIASGIILAFSLWAMIAPDNASATMQSVVGWIATNLGWYYVVTVVAVIVFILWVALSKEGSVRLGPDHSRPQYKMFTWVAMLFAAGVGIDMLFYSVGGPIEHYLQPPSAEPASAAAAQDAVVWTMFHYGISGWSMYALLGMAMGYFAYRWGMPLSIRAALYPLLGKRVRGKLGDSIDVVTLLGTVFGVATSMGIGVVLLSVGFSWIFGIPDGLGLQVALVLVAVAITIAACTSGVDKGIRLISELNIWVAGAMMLYILVTGQTAFLLSSLVSNIGRFIGTLPQRILETFSYVGVPDETVERLSGAEWMGGQTLFFWAFWLAWGPFVGLFLARISRGRTLREFVLAAITVPVLCDFIIVSFFGNSALFEVMTGNTDFAQLALENPEAGWYALLEMFPGAAFLIGLATLSGLLFYLTSANSGAMVMANFSSSIPNPAEDGAKWLRIFWAVVTAVLTVAMLIAGGVVTMEYATLIFALPFTIIAYLVMFSFSKVLRMERAERQGTIMRRRSAAAHGGLAPEKTWQQRLASLRSYPGTKQVAQFVEGVIQPAMRDVAAEFRDQGYTAHLAATPSDLDGIDEYILVVDMGDQRDFHYQVSPVEAPVPRIGGRTTSRGDDLYYRLEVFTQTGTEGYDLMGLTGKQVINDVLDRYEAHLAFVQFSEENAADSVVAPPGTPPTATSTVPVVADDVEKVEN